MSFQIGDSLYLAAEEIMDESSQSICIMTNGQISSPSNSKQTVLCDLISFCERLQLILERDRNQNKIFVCPIRRDSQCIAEACFYLGSFLILSSGWKYIDVVAAFRFHNELAPFLNIELVLGKISALDGWRALDRSVQLGWFVHPDSDDEPVLDVDELTHYSSRANGMVHLTVPGDLIFFPTPTHLPDGEQWTDYTREDGSTVRRFSAQFYAELFKDLNVSVVVCLGAGSEAAASALSGYGIESMDLGLSADGSSLLRGLDALLSLARATPGAVAVHSGEGFVWPGYVGTLVEAFLISRLGFDEGSAGAWLRMAGPWMLPIGRQRSSP